jgi:hypothetical protein
VALTSWKKNLSESVACSGNTFKLATSPTKSLSFLKRFAALETKVFMSGISTSASKKMYSSPWATLAPKFLPMPIVCLSPFSFLTTLSAYFSAISKVLSVLPPSETIIS